MPSTPALPSPEDVLKLLKGPTGPIGPAGPTGPAGVGGGGSSEASSFGKYTGVGSTGGLASGKQESGLWSATIHAPAGSFQQQAQGVASFPIPLKFHAKVTLNYRTEGAATSAPCLGSVEEPVVSPVGNFCAYRGGKSAGAKETGANGSVDKEAQFIGFEGSGGEAITETGPAGEGDDGVLIVFRTNTFETAGPARELLAEADLNAIGSWAVAAK